MLTEETIRAKYLAGRHQYTRLNQRYYGLVAELMDAGPQNRRELEMRLDSMARQIAIMFNMLDALSWALGDTRPLANDWEVP